MRLLFLALVSFESAFALNVKNASEANYFYSETFQVSRFDATVKEAFANVSSRIPRTGEVTGFSASSLLGYVELAGSYCARFIQQEKTAAGAGILHSHISFAQKASAIADKDIEKLTQNYAQRLWERNATDDELKYAVAFWGNLKAEDQPIDKALRSFCAAMATTLDSIVTR